MKAKKYLSVPFYQLLLPLLRKAKFVRPCVYDWAAYELERNNIQVTGVVDGGAYDGTVSLLLARLFPRATIYAFEPSPDSFAMLQKSITHQRRIKPIQSALSNVTDQKMLNINKVGVTNSLLPADVNDDAQEQFQGWAETIEKTAVQTITLDDFLCQAKDFKPQLLKLDVQGYELYALQGAQAALQDSIRAVVAEFRFFTPAYEGDTSMLQRLDAFLADLGFRLSCIPACTNHIDKRTVFEADGLWVRK